MLVLVEVKVYKQMQSFQIHRTCGNLARFNNRNNSLAHRRGLAVAARSFVTEIEGWEMPPPGKKQFSFGVISDIQYADIPDGKSYHGVPRYYRNSRVALKRAVNTWCGMDLDFAVHFGDILDGYHPKVMHSMQQ